MKTLTPLFLFYFFTQFLFLTTSFATEIDTADNLRTLFTSSHLRDQLDKQRQAGKFSNKQTTSPTTTSRKPVTVKMQGVVIRDSHKPVVFINDDNTIKSHKIHQQIIVNDKTVTDNYTVPVRINQKTIKLKPGQQWDESKNRVTDDFLVKPEKTMPSANAEEVQELEHSTDNQP